MFTPNGGFAIDGHMTCIIKTMNLILIKGLYRDIILDSSRGMGLSSYIEIIDNGSPTYLNGNLFLKRRFHVAETNWIDDSRVKN